MGGFLYNGCGASDSYYKIKDLEAAYCNSCKTVRTFQLMELKRKIRVFWVPTLSIDTKYAVVCPYCKNGWYVEEHQKDSILKGTVSVEIGEDGITLQKVQKKQPTPPPLQTSLKAGGDLKETDKEGQSDIEKSHKLSENKSNISKSGILEEDISMNQILHKKICPSCKLQFMGDKTHCSICGKMLIEKTE